MNFTLTFNELLTLIAIFVGPIVAVWIQRYLDHSRAESENRVKIFKTLMTTRGTPLASSHVEALNMISVAFYGSSRRDRSVVAKWKEYHDHLNSCPQDVSSVTYQHDFSVWRAKMADLVVELLVIMGQAVGFEFDPVEVRKGVYRPKGHDDLEVEQSFLRHSLIEVFSGKKAIPIALYDQAKRIVL